MKKFDSNIHVGKFQLGWHMVNLYVMPYERGGMFNVNKDGHSEPEMHIGINEKDLGRIWTTLAHEAMEFAIGQVDCSYAPRNAFEPDVSDVPLFVFNHNQFTEIAARSGLFLYNVKDVIAQWWKKTASVRK